MVIKQHRDFWHPNPHDIPTKFSTKARLTGECHGFLFIIAEGAVAAILRFPNDASFRPWNHHENSTCWNVIQWLYIYIFIYLRYDMVIYLYMVIYRPMVQSSPPSVSVSVIAASRVGYHHSSWQHVDLCTQQLCSTQVRRASTVEEHLHSLPLRRRVAWRKYGEVMVKLGDQHVSTHLKTMKIWVSSRWK